MNLPTDPRIGSAKYENKCSKKFKNKFDQRQGKKYEFVQTQFILDEHYIGKLPRVQVGIVNLNDNIDENFLRKEISKVGQIRTLEIVRDPKTKRHLGLAKVVFNDEQLASLCIEKYHDKSLMGQKLEVFLDLRFQRIEHERAQILNPEPKTRIQPTQPTLQHSVPIVNPLAQLPFSPAQIPPPIKPEIRLERIPHANLSLDDRLAKLGLKQTSAYPPLPHQVYPKQGRNINQQQYHQHNYPVLRQEKKPDVSTSPFHNFVVEDEKDWDPEPVKEEKIEEPIEKINLTTYQIDNEVLPHCFEKFVKELEKNLLTTLQRRLIQTHGYPLINEAQERYKQAFQQKKLEELREKHERQRLEILARFNKERKYIGQKPIYVPKQAEPVRFKRDNGASRANFINRSAANLSQDRRQQSRGSSCDTSSRHSRDPSPDGSIVSSISSSSRSTSRTSTSSSSSSSSSSSESSLSSSRSTSRSVSPSSYSSASPTPITNEDSEIVAIEALVQLQESSQAHVAYQKPINKVEPIPAKKRKRKTPEVVIPSKKSKTVESVDKRDGDTTPKPVKLCPRSAEEIQRRYSSLEYLLEDLDLEDKKFLDEYHNTYVEGENLAIDNSNSAASSAHLLVKNNDIESEIASGRHPKWWTGCSRCAKIEISDKGKIEEAVDDDLQKASIKSHVIQAANSTRRDLRNDQRRIAALNPEIDPSLLKQFTSNTLQMRAKNLRFSRSKIHKWGLFACEKIANGDAVIEYVGEKIRPSLADHREKIVYTNLPTHDGSSYFFRVDYDVIDATLKGNKARFINHSCNPNCIAKVIKHDNGTNSIVIYAKQAIDVDEEITYDYKFPREEGTETKILCRCKAPNCQKYLN